MRRIKLSQPQNVAANSVASLSTDQVIGQSLIALEFKRGGTIFTAAHMTDIEVVVGDKPLIRGINGTQLQSINTNRGLSTSGDKLYHHFGDPTAVSARGKYLGALDCSIHTAPLEFTITIGAATAPTLEVYAWVSTPKAQMNLGYTEEQQRKTRALIRTQLTFSAAVAKQQHRISFGSTPGGDIRSLFCFHGGNLSSVEFKKQGITKWHDTTQDDADDIGTEYGRVAVGNLYVMDHVLDGNQGQAEATLTPDGQRWVLEHAFTSSAADVINVFADMHINRASI